MDLALQNNRKAVRGIVTMQGTKYLITQEELEKLRTAGLNDMFMINGAAIKVSTIAEIMELDNFYTAYPEQRPHPIIEANKNWLEADMVSGGVFERSPDRGRQQMIKGMEKYISEHPDAKKAKAMLAMMKAKV